MGSACSILALEMKKNEQIFCEDLKQGESGEPGLAYLLGGPITLDTYFFRESLKYSTWFDEDIHAHEFLS
jgi:hypothetical protein